SEAGKCVFYLGFGGMRFLRFIHAFRIAGAPADTSLPQLLVYSQVTQEKRAGGDEVSQLPHCLPVPHSIHDRQLAPPPPALCPHSTTERFPAGADESKANRLEVITSQLKPSLPGDSANVVAERGPRAVELFGKAQRQGGLAAGDPTGNCQHNRLHGYQRVN